MEGRKRLSCRAEGLWKKYGNRWVVHDVSITIEEGEIVGLLGPNGAGKTTTFYMIAGLIQGDRGRIYFDDIDITDFPMYQRARLGLIYLPQEPSIFRRLTVRENIEAILEIQGYSARKRRIRCDEILMELGLTHVANTRGYHLSGGERRKVEIGRALAGGPKFLLLDEPFTGIDPLAIRDIQNILITLKNKNIGILITDHNVRDTLKITERAFIISKGKILAHGFAREIAQNPVVQKEYLGEDFELS